jgi:hypothetical protein
MNGYSFAVETHGYRVMRYAYVVYCNGVEVERSSDYSKSYFDTYMRGWIAANNLSKRAAAIAATD